MIVGFILFFSTHKLWLPTLFGETVVIISYRLLRPHDENAEPLITKEAISKIIHLKPLMPPCKINTITT